MSDRTNDIDLTEAQYREADALLRHLDNCYWPQKHAALVALVAERDALKDELERERMRLAACGVVAISNTRETAKENREVSDEYKSSSFDHVCAAVDREMALRERVAELESQSPPSNLRQRDEAMTRWMDQVTAMLCHSMTHSHDAKQELVARCDAAIAAMRKGDSDGK